MCSQPPSNSLPTNSAVTGTADTEAALIRSFFAARKDAKRARDDANYACATAAIRTAITIDGESSGPLAKELQLEAAQLNAGYLSAITLQSDMKHHSAFLSVLSPPDGASRRNLSYADVMDRVAQHSRVVARMLNQTDRANCQSSAGETVKPLPAPSTRPTTAPVIAVPIDGAAPSQLHATPIPPNVFKEESHNTATSAKALACPATHSPSVPPTTLQVPPSASSVAAHSFLAQFQRPSSHGPSKQFSRPVAAPLYAQDGDDCTAEKHAASKVVDTNDPASQKLAPKGDFISAAQQLEKDVRSGKAVPFAKKPTLGLRRQPFVPPLASAKDDAPAVKGLGNTPVDRILSATQKPKKDDDENPPLPPSLLLPDGSVPPKLQGLDPKLLTQITYEIVESGSAAAVDWSDIAGLENAKTAVEEAIVWPLKRPDLFCGLRDPPRGLLLFGPPGTGKTMIARAIASRANCTFLNISASSMMSKWVGDGEKSVRCLFAVAAVRQPSVVFIDEIDSLLSMRGEGEMDAVRRVKTEFLVHLDGVATDTSDRILVIGATNRPNELDEAARRRMEKRLYIPLPDHSSRMELVRRLINKCRHEVKEEEIAQIASLTDGYSGADIKLLCREASMLALRELRGSIGTVNAADVRPLVLSDFAAACKRVRPSVGKGELRRYEEWNEQFGSFSVDQKPAEELE